MIHSPNFKYSYFKYSNCISQQLISILNLTFNFSTLSRHLSSACWSEGREVFFFFLITALLSRGFIVNMWGLRGMWLARWRCDAIWAAACLRPGSVERRWVPGLSLIVWWSERSQKFTTHRGSDLTWPDPAEAGLVKQIGPDGTRLGRISVRNDRPPHWAACAFAHHRFRYLGAVSGILSASP